MSTLAFVAPTIAHLSSRVQRTRVARSLGASRAGRVVGRRVRWLRVEASDGGKLWFEQLPIVGPVLSAVTPPRVKQAATEMEYFGQAPLQARPTAPIPVLGASSRNEVPIYDFTSSGNDAANFRAVWGALNDVVMGGSSEGAGSIVTIPEEDGGTCARLGGVVEGQSGGFVSMRTRNFESPLDLSQYDGVRLKIRGDGNRFKLILYDEDDWWGSIAFHAAFDTVEGAWLTVDVPFASFRAVRRGEAVPEGSPDLRTLRTTSVRSMQLMLSKFTYGMGDLNPSFASGPFYLEVSKVSAYRGDAGATR